MKFADKIQYLMDEKGLTQDALGRELGLTHRAVGNWLGGSRPHQRTAAMLASFFGVSVGELLNDDQDLPLRPTRIVVATNEAPALKEPQVLREATGYTPSQPIQLPERTDAISRAWAEYHKLPDGLRGRIADKMLDVFFEELSKSKGRP